MPSFRKTIPCVDITHSFHSDAARAQFLYVVTFLSQLYPYLRVQGAKPGGGRAPQNVNHKNDFFQKGCQL